MPAMDQYGRRHEEQELSFPWSLLSSPKKIGLVVGAVILGSTFLSTAYTIHQTERGIVTRNGAFLGITDPGLHFKLPWIDDVKTVNMETHRKSWEHIEAYTKDTQQTFIKVTVIYRSAPDKLEELYSRFRGDVDAAVDRLIGPNVFADTKTVFGKYEASKAISDRGKLNEDATLAIQQALRTDPVITIENILIEDIQFSQAYIHSIEERMQAEVMVAKLDQQVKQAQKEAEKTVTIAQGEADAKRKRADADAYAVKVAGEAEALAIKAKQEALSKAGPEFVNYTYATKWLGQVPTTVLPNSSAPFISIDKK